MKAKSDIQRKSTAFEKALLCLNIGLRLYSAFYMIIPDCDETFNYWEPLNLLLRGFGKETWEYSPEYSIRSYAYLVSYFVIAYPIKVLQGFVDFPSYFLFYWIRVVGLIGFTVYAERHLYYSIKQVNSSVANWFIFLSSISTGMSHAGVALLPSSFAMNCQSMALAYIFRSFVIPKVSLMSTALIWFMVSGIVGWPFAVALGIPFGFYVLYVNLNSWEKLYQLFVRCFISLLAIACFSVVIDTWFYKKVDFVPLNIVLYNVFSGEGEGPEIFGVEPFSYYVFNLLINFNIIAVIGYMGIVTNLFMKRGYRYLIAIELPLSLWSVIFGSQPHKEERFLYPIYPHIILSCSISMSGLFSGANNLVGLFLRSGKYSKALTKTSELLFGIAVCVVSLLRTINLVENYSAPFPVHKTLALLPTPDTIQYVCTGREWYHFPNSFFLPENYRLQFVKSGFDGLLPGDFLEQHGLQASTSSIPPDMNNKNIFSEMKVIDPSHCDYYIDNDAAVDQEKGETQIITLKNYEVTAAKGWQILNCKKIIDPDGISNTMSRVVWVPPFLRTFIPYKIAYMNYCLSQKQDKN